MTSLGGIAIGFVAGVGVAAAAVITVPSLVPTPAFTPIATQAIGPSAQAEASAKPLYVVAPVNTDPGPVQGDPLGELDVTARVAVMRFMAANPQYAFITRDFCNCHEMPITNCPEYDAQRDRELADYPYSEVLDYNGDGVTDFALMLQTKDAEGPQVLFIFNGPFRDEIPKPVLVREGWQINDRISSTFAGPPESDNGYNIKANGETYELEYAGDPG